MIAKASALRLGITASALGLMLIGVGRGDERVIRPTTTFYVSPEGGDDSPGTRQQPFRTLQQAVKVAAPGDTVLARPGEYAGFVLGWDVPLAGSADAPITFTAQPGAVIVSRNNKTADGIDLEPGCDYVVIQGFTVKNTANTIRRAGIRVGGSAHVSVIGNVVQDAGTWGIFTSHCNDVLIENNTASGSQKEHGIYVSNSVDHPVVRGNTVFGNRMCGIHLNGDASQSGNGMIINALIENNIVHDNGAGGGSAINCDGLRNSIIRCNLLYGNHASGISLYRQDASAGSTGNFVVNNTIVMASNARFAVNINSHSFGNVIWNNVLLDSNRWAGSIKVTPESRDGLVSDYNIVEDHLSPDGDENCSLEEWQSETGLDMHSRCAAVEQLFVNAQGNDFHLSPTSPAVHAGVTEVMGHESPLADLEGNPFATHWDIGAYQSGTRSKSRVQNGN
jgi:parallel beta-helix repeat protein